MDTTHDISIKLDYKCNHSHCLQHGLLQVELFGGGIRDLFELGDVLVQSHVQDLEEVGPTLDGEADNVGDALPVAVAESWVAQRPDHWHLALELFDLFSHVHHQFPENNPSKTLI